MTFRRVAEIVDVASTARAGVRLASSEDTQYLTDNTSRRCPDLTKTKATIDWAPLVSLREGLERTLAFYRESGAR